MTDHTELIDPTGALRERADAMWQDLLPLMQAESETGYADKVAALDIIERALTAADASIAELTRERDGMENSRDHAEAQLPQLARRAETAEAALAASQAEVERLREGIAREREECAALVDAQNTTLEGGAGSENYWRGVIDGQRASARAIRARTLTADEPPQEQPK